jgi:hypothetical protein
VDSKTAIKPRLSVILPALLGYDSVLAALDSWEAQSCRDQLEIVVLCPAKPKAEQFPRGLVVIETGSLQLHEARAVGIAQATADYIVLAEDHCIPDKLWAQAMLDRLGEGWDVVGPALRSGNPKTWVTQAAFLLGYGQWMPPLISGPAAVLPGHNAVLRKESLLKLGPALKNELLVAAFLVRRLHDQGQRFFLEDRATMRHFDLPHWRKELQIFYRVGLGFGAVRTSRWPRAAGALYWLASPAIAIRHWARALSQYLRAGTQAGLSPFCLVGAFLLALAWACGESAGALLGVARVTPLLSFAEIKPVARKDV